jgi:anti-sigma factor RsiW
MTEPIDENLEFRLCQYLDGQLGRREQAALEKRLAADPALRDELKRYAALNGQLGALRENAGAGPEVNYDLQRAEIVAAVERKLLLARRRRPLVLRPVFGALAAAVVLLVSVGVLVLLQTGPGTPVEPPVRVIVLPVAPPSGGAGEVLVRVEPDEPEQIPSAPGEEAAPQDVPDGTVVVSIGAGTARAQPPLADAMVIY